MANKIKKTRFNFTWFYLVIGGLLLFFYVFGDGGNNLVKETEYSELTGLISKGYVEEIVVYDNDEIEAVIYKDSAKHVFDNLPANLVASPMVVSTIGSRDNFEKFIFEEKEKGSFDGSHALDLNALKWDSFAEAYAETILRLRHFYPEAEIIAISPSISGGYYDNSRLCEFADLALQICSHYNVRCVDARTSGLTFDMLPDTLHPNAEGMKCIYKSVMNILKKDI